MSYYNFAELGDLERTLFTQKHNPCVFRFKNLLNF